MLARLKRLKVTNLFWMSCCCCLWTIGPIANAESIDDFRLTLSNQADSSSQTLLDFTLSRQAFAENLPSVWLPEPPAFMIAEGDTNTTQRYNPYGNASDGWVTYGVSEYCQDPYSEYCVAYTFSVYLNGEADTVDKLCYLVPNSDELGVGRKWIFNLEQQISTPIEGQAHCLITITSRENNDPPQSQAVYIANQTDDQLQPTSRHDEGELIQGQVQLSPNAGSCDINGKPCETAVIADLSPGQTTPQPFEFSADPDSYYLAATLRYAINESSYAAMGVQHDLLVTLGNGATVEERCQVTIEPPIPTEDPNYYVVSATPAVAA